MKSQIKSEVYEIISETSDKLKELLRVQPGQILFLTWRLQYKSGKSTGGGARLCTYAPEEDKETPEWQMIVINAIWTLLGCLVFVVLIWTSLAQHRRSKASDKRREQMEKDLHKKMIEYADAQIRKLEGKEPWQG